MVAIDCIDSPQSRIKVYLRTAVDTLSRAKTAFSLGGRLKGETIDKGLEALEELWSLLFDLEENKDVAELKILPAGSYCGKAIEMKPGAKQPEVKLHIPIRKREVNDIQIAESLCSWFRRRGHADFASRYVADLEKAS